MKPIAHEQRQVAAVVDMGMREHDRIDVMRVDGKLVPVAQTQRLVALKQPAVDHHTVRAGLKHIL